jgi:hypothetical protein
MAIEPPPAPPAPPPTQQATPPPTARKSGCFGRGCGCGCGGCLLVLALAFLLAAGREWWFFRAFGAVITHVTVRGINVTTQVVSKLSSLGPNSITSIPSGFIVDRVYSCATASGDNMMVIGGQR